LTSIAWGLIGAGDIVRKRVGEALREGQGCELVAVSRARVDLAEAFAREAGARRWHKSWRDLVADEDVDAVYVATPVHLHAEQAIAAAEAGKHVLCEKPMAMTAAECDRMIAACRAHGVRLGIAYYRRFYPAVVRAAAILTSGEIGQPVFAQMNAFEYFDPPADHPRHWLLDPAASGGGPMMDFGCHRVEVLLHLLGPVRRTVSIAANVAFERDVEDTAAVLLQFEQGPVGVVAVTHASRTRQDTLQLFGTQGSLQIDELNAGTIRIRVGERERVESHPPAANVHLPLVEDFVDAVLTGREPAVTGGMGRAVAVIEDQLYAASSRAAAGGP
jgi:predicted dehydrogenase